MKRLLKISNVLLAGLLIAALSACVGVNRQVARPVEPPGIGPGMPGSSSGELTTAVVTLIPAATATALESASTPVAGETAQVDPQANLDLPELSLDLISSAPETQAWQDCSLAGGWVGCDPNAPAFAARLAFFQPSGPFVVALDLLSGSGWSVGSPADLPADTPRVSWSPDAQFLLAALSDGTYGVYRADGTGVGTYMPGDQGAPVWQPNGVLALPETVHSAEGVSARLEMSDDLRWRLHLRSATGGEDQVLDLDPQPTDRLYRLIGFVPGSSLILGQSFFAGNQAMMQGGQLFTFDVQTGERRDVEAMAPLGWQGAFAWNQPADGSPPTLAFTDSGALTGGLPTLGLFNWATGELRHPLPEGVAIGALDWQPGSGELAFAAEPQSDVLPPESAQIFQQPAIYQLSPDGAVRALTQPPAGARDGLPRWTADGETLLFARWYTNGALEVRAVIGGQEWLIVAGITADCPAEGPGCPWDRFLDIQAQE